MDYNIYIHSIGAGGQSSPTTPWQPQNQVNIPWGAQEGEIGNEGASPEALAMGAGSAAMKFAGAAAMVAAAVLVVKAAQSIYSGIVLPVSTQTTGDYRASVAYNNFQNTLSQVFSPISHAINYQKAKLTIRLEDERRAQNRLLLGDSEINQYTGKGV